MQLCAGFILHFVAVLAAPDVRNATVSHTPPVPEGCSGLSASVVWDEPMFGGKAFLWFMVVIRAKGETELVGNAASDASSKILSTAWDT